MAASTWATLSRVYKGIVIAVKNENSKKKNIKLCYTFLLLNEICMMKTYLDIPLTVLNVQILRDGRWPTHIHTHTHKRHHFSIAKPSAVVGLPHNAHTSPDPEATTVTTISLTDKRIHLDSLNYLNVFTTVFIPTRYVIDDQSCKL